MPEQTSCRCHRSLDVPAGEHWWPQRESEPGGEIRVVVMAGEDPGFLRWVRVPGGWHQRGAAACHANLTPPTRWSEVGLCWDDRSHPVVDATNWAPLRITIATTSAARSSALRVVR